MSLQTAHMPLGFDFDVSAIAAQTNGFSGSDLAGLCREAGVAAMSRNLDCPSGTSREEVQSAAEPLQKMLQDHQNSDAHTRGPIYLCSCRKLPDCGWEILQTKEYCYKR